MCPVQSFLTYLYSLSKESNNLWQTPKFTEFPEDPKVRVYYGPGAVGHNTHEQFIGKIAKNSGFQDFKYTNHSLRVTAITVLGSQNYSNKQIMSITGHKSSTSLETYQRVSGTEKIQMGLSLSNSLLQSTALVSYSPPVPQNKPPANAIDAPLPLEANIAPINNELEQDLDISDQDLMNIIQQAESNNSDLMLSQTKQIATSSEGTTIKSKNTLTKKSSPIVPIFTGCTFTGNVTININK